MQNSLYSFIKKETLHILRDLRTMLIVFCLPILLTLLFGFAITTEIKVVRIAAVAPMRTDAIADAVSKLSNSDSFVFTGYIEPSEVDEQLRSGKVAGVVVFASDYDKIILQIMQGIPTKPAVQVILDASNTNTASAVGAYIQNILMLDSGVSNIFQTHLLFNPQMKSAFNFVPGILGMVFMLICAMMTSVSIVREKEMGTMEVLLVSPVNPMRVVLAKMIPYFLFSCFTLLFVLLISHYILQVPVSTRLWELILLSLIYLVLSLSLGLLISTIAERQATALLFSAMVLMIPTVMLSGMFFPIENMPLPLQGISALIPARWYISAARKLMIEGQPILFVLKEFTVLIIMVFILINISLRKFKYRLE